MSKIGNYVVGLQEAMIDCPECDGEGRCEYERAVPMSNSNPYGYLEGYWAECENCGGTGIIEADLEDDDE
jgi:DnaJ-class molecular chaperone